MDPHETVSDWLHTGIQRFDSQLERRLLAHHSAQTGSEFRPAVWSMGSVFVVSVLPRCKAEKVYVYSGGGLNSSMAGFSCSHSVKYRN
jgi:hypothetical protein